LNFLKRFSQNTQISNFKKISPVGYESFKGDGQTDVKRHDMTRQGMTNRFIYLFSHAQDSLHKK